MKIPDELYHYTYTKNVDSILVNGLIPGKGESEYCPIINDTKTVWMDSFYYSPPSRNCSILAIDTSKIDLTKLRQVDWHEEWFRYEGIITSEAIELVETG